MPSPTDVANVKVDVSDDSKELTRKCEDNEPLVH